MRKCRLSGICPIISLDRQSSSASGALKQPGLRVGRPCRATQPHVTPAVLLVFPPQLSGALPRAESQRSGWIGTTVHDLHDKKRTPGPSRCKSILCSIARLVYLSTSNMIQP